jgi:hypothetical protein
MMLKPSTCLRIYTRSKNIELDGINPSGVLFKVYDTAYETQNDTVAAVKKVYKNFF